MPKLRHTRADYERLPEGVYAQLIEGELVMTPAPTPRHEQLVARFILRVGAFLGPDSDGRVLASKLDVVTGQPPDEEVVQPDVAVLPDGARATGSRWNPSTPVLVAEILSPSTQRYDRGAKLRVFAAAGVEEAWLLDPEGRIIEVHDLGTTRKRVYAKGEVAGSRAVPGFRVDVGAFFAA